MSYPGSMPEEVPPPRSNRRLTDEQRAEVLRRLGTGESNASIARDYKVSRAAISLIKMKTFRAEQPGGEPLYKKRLLPTEVAELKAVIKQTLPADHGAIMAGDERPDRWTVARARALGKKLFGKTPSVRALQECLPEPPDYRDAHGMVPPKPPGPRDVALLPPDLAADEDFVRYYLSPLALQIEQREYAAAMADYQQRIARMAGRQAEESPTDPAAAPLPVPEDAPLPSQPAEVLPTAPGTRVGKHAKSKGSPFTKPKRRKKKR